MSRFHLSALSALAAAVLLAACAQGVKAPTSAAEVGEAIPGTGFLKGYLGSADMLVVDLAPAQLGFLKGYLGSADMPDSLALVPPPPVEGSPAYAEDVAAFKALTALQSGPRGAQARRDAELRFPAAANHFACALGVPVSEEQTPHLNMLLQRTMMSAGGATYKAKNNYQRTRPFVAMQAGSCTPEQEARLSHDGSYPSGHAALGWAWTLVLTQLAPDRADALVQRGRSFGQSRAVCGVHWKSDITAGQMVGAAAVARLQDDAVFQAQMTAARREIAQARTQGLMPPAELCEAEAKALSLSTHLAP